MENDFQMAPKTFWTTFQCLRRGEAVGDDALLTLTPDVIDTDTASVAGPGDPGVGSPISGVEVAVVVKKLLGGRATCGRDPPRVLGTAPIMAPLGADPQAQPASSGTPQALVPGPHGTQVPYSGLQQQQQFPAPPMKPAMPKTSTEGAPGAPTRDVIQVETPSELFRERTTS